MRFARRSIWSRNGGRSIAPACPSASTSTATVPPFDDEREDRSADEHEEEGDREGGQRRRIGAQRRKDRGEDLAHIAAQQLLDVGVEQQHHEEDAADDGHAED